MSTIYPAPATEPGTTCPCTAMCDAERSVGATYAPGGHDAKASAWLTRALGLTPCTGETLCNEYGSVGAAHRAFLDTVAADVPAGRDLTEADVRDVLGTSIHPDDVDAVAERLNRIVRGDR